MYDQIFEMSYYGQGGFPYDAVVEMPVNVRSYYYAKLADIMEARKQEAEKANKTGRFKK